MSDGALTNVRGGSKNPEKQTYSAIRLAFVSKAEAKSWHTNTVHLE